MELAAYRHATQLENELPFAQYNLGMACLASGRRQEARDAFRAFLRLTPDTPEYRDKIAQARRHLEELSR